MLAADVPARLMPLAAIVWAIFWSIFAWRRTGPRVTLEARHAVHRLKDRTAHAVHLIARAGRVDVGIEDWGFTLPGPAADLGFGYRRLPGERWLEPGYTLKAHHSVDWAAEVVISDENDLGLRGSGTSKPSSSPATDAESR
jgi:hypothetical protein